MVSPHRERCLAMTQSPCRQATQEQMFQSEERSGCDENWLDPAGALTQQPAPVSGQRNGE
jgi:hypothetical protein